MLPPPPPGFDRALGQPPFRARLLYNRGIRTRAEVEPYLAADSRLLNDPMLLPDMDRAVGRLRKALRSGEAIGIFGDFDTDGVTGTALLVRALRDLDAPVIPVLPDRVDEGHGLNREAVGFLRDQGVSVLVTVDCGTTSIAEVDLAASLGMDTIITDHHSITASLPRALALINPRRPDSAYPYGGLTGAGLAYKLAQALYEDMGQPCPDYLLELAALGTVADVGTLVGENRYLVKRGIELLNQTQHPGLMALISRAGFRSGSLDTEALSFGLIPRLNVAGRLDHAILSLNLLTATTPETAAAIAEELEGKNLERQRLTEQGVREAMQQVEAQSNGAVPAIIIVKHRDWLPGILGLIANKLVDAYCRPAVAISVGDEVCRASARSIPELNIVEALRKSRRLFLQHGGHPRAAGFTMPTAHLPELERELRAVAEETLAGMELKPCINIDCEVSPSLLAGANLGFIQSLEPFGEDNPVPAFLTRKARVVNARLVGRSGQHLKLKVSHGGAIWDAIAFNQGGRTDLARERVDLVYSVALDSWNGQPRLQLTVLDFQPASGDLTPSL